MSFRGFLLCVLAGVLTVAGAATVKQHHAASNGKPSHRSQHGPTVHHKVIHNNTETSRPHVEAFLQDFKGDPVRNLTVRQRSHVVLPHLDVDAYLWEGLSIQLKCAHDSPVQWVYHGDGAPIVRTTTSRLAPIMNNRASFHFGATVIFSQTSFKQTGLYTCESIAHPKQRTDLYVFVPGKRVFVLAHETDSSYHHEPIHLTLYAQPNNNKIKIPCSVSTPNASVQLFKDGKDILNYTKNLIFDPKHGFEIDSEALSNIWGRYKCLDRASQETITFEAEPSKYVLVGSTVNGQQDSNNNKILTYNENPFELTHYAHIKFHHDVKKRLLTCCAFDFRGERLNQHPIMKFSPCDNPSECNIARKRFQATSCAGTSQRERAVICEGKPMKRHCRGFILPESDDAGIIQCSVGDTAEEYFQYSKVGDVVITDFSHVPGGPQALEIIEEPPSMPGTRKYTCLPNSFFFAEGIKWAIESQHSKHLHFIEEDFPPKISVDIKPEEATKVYCFAPIWNSFEWRNVSISIT